MLVVLTIVFIYFVLSARLGVLREETKLAYRRIEYLENIIDHQRAQRDLADWRRWKDTGDAYAVEEMPDADAVHYNETLANYRAVRKHVTGYGAPTETTGG